MSEPVKPALTPEEWERALVDSDNGKSDFLDIAFGHFAGKEAVFIEPRQSSPHALAALALYGQPYGFSREDVVFLREVAEKVRAGAKHENWHVGDELESLADRIEALLPPEDAKG